MESTEGTSKPSFELKAELTAALTYLKSFIQNPVGSLRKAPDWSWPALLIVIAVVSVALGALTGFGSVRLSPLRFRAFDLIVGPIVTPLSALFVTAVLSGLMYYTSLFIFHIQLQFRRLMILVFLSCIPWFLVAPISNHLPVLNPIGAILSAMLAIVAFSENTPHKKETIVKLVGIITTLFVVFWVVNMISWTGSGVSGTNPISTESLDILERELGNKGD